MVSCERMSQTYLAHGVDLGDIPVGLISQVNLETSVVSFGFCESNLSLKRGMSWYQSQEFHGVYTLCA